MKLWIPKSDRLIFIAEGHSKAIDSDSKLFLLGKNEFNLIDDNRQE